MPTPQQAKLMRERVIGVIMALQCTEMRLPEAMTLERAQQLTDDELAGYGLRLHAHSLWRSVPFGFEIVVKGSTLKTGKQELLHALMVGLAPYQRERVYREEGRRRR